MTWVHRKKKRKKFKTKPLMSWLAIISSILITCFISSLCLSLCEVISFLNSWFASLNDLVIYDFVLSLASQLMMWFWESFELSWAIKKKDAINFNVDDPHEIENLLLIFYMTREKREKDYGDKVLFMMWHPIRMMKWLFLGIIRWLNLLLLPFYCLI